MSKPTGREPGFNASSEGFQKADPVVPKAPTPNSIPSSIPTSQEDVKPNAIDLAAEKMNQLKVTNKVELNLDETIDEQVNEFQEIISEYELELQNPTQGRDKRWLEGQLSMFRAQQKPWLMLQDVLKVHSGVDWQGNPDKDGPLCRGCSSVGFPILIKYECSTRKVLKEKVSVETNVAINANGISIEAKQDLMDLAERFDNQTFPWDITEEAMAIVQGITSKMRKLAS